jgi:hypothetical protein
VIAHDAETMLRQAHPDPDEICPALSQRRKRGNSIVSAHPPVCEKHSRL